MTAVHVVTLLEEMPVQETLDAIDGADRPGHPGRPDHRQRAPGRRCSAGAKSPAPSCGAALAAAGLPADRETVAGLRRRGAGRTRPGCEVEAALRAELADAGPADGRAAARCRAG